MRIFFREMPTNRIFKPAQNVLNLANPFTNPVHQDRRTFSGYSSVVAKDQGSGGTDRGQTWGQPPIRRPGRVVEK